MARSNQNGRLPHVDERATIDKMAVGDDRVGPETPPWVVPSVSGGARGWLAARDDDFHRRYPVLHDFLTLVGWSGKERQSGSMNIFAQDGKFKVALNDRENGLVAFLSADSVEELLGGLDASLKSGRLDWRKSNFKKK